MSNDTPTEIRKGRTAPFSMVPDWIIVSAVSPQAKALFSVLQAHANQQRGNGRVWPGVDTIAELLGYRRRQSIVRYVRELAVLGAIDVETETTRTGKRNTYTVHELPPEGYAGPITLAEFYEQQRAGRDLSIQDVSIQDVSDREVLEGGRTLERPRGRTPQRPTGRTLERPRTRRSELNEVEQDESSSSTSSGGAHAMARASLRADQHAPKPLKKPGRLEGKHLVGKPVPTITQRITTLWSAVVVEQGGELPETGSGGWDADGTPAGRAEHPLGSQLKKIIERVDPGDISAEWLDTMIVQVRDHAKKWTERQLEQRDVAA